MWENGGKQWNLTFTEINKMNYQELKAKHSKQITDFQGLFFAFSESQLNEGLLKIGAKIEEICSIGAGGYILKSKRKDFDDMFKSFEAEIKEFRKSEKNLVNAIIYELGNHEYSYTRDVQDTIEAMGLDVNDTFTANCLKKACKKYLKSCYENEMA